MPGKKKHLLYTDNLQKKAHVSWNSRKELSLQTASKKNRGSKGGVVKTPPSTTSGLFLISPSGPSKKRKNEKKD